MSQTQPIPDQRVISFMALRKAIGLIGILLPFMLAVLYMLLVSRLVLRGSVSDYYYTGSRNILVGDLCAIGVFLFAYRGYGFWDNLCTNAAGAFAIGVAMFPTAPPDPSATAKAVGYVHLACAGLLFAMLAVIALVLFTRADSRPGDRPAAKRRRNAVYYACGGVIVACLVLVPVEAFVLGAAVARYQPLFWLETTAIIAFGVAWLVKGQAILRDPRTPPPPAPPGPDSADSSRVLAGQPR